MTKISIENAVQLTDTCMCCNTLEEIKEKLKEYNQKNHTEYILEIEYVLYTTKNCGMCNMVKNLISSQYLKIKNIEATEKEVLYLQKNDIGTFPVLELKAGKKSQFISGKDVGEYLASNLEKFK